MFAKQRDRETFGQQDTREMENLAGLSADCLKETERGGYMSSFLFAVCEGWNKLLSALNVDLQNKNAAFVIWNFKSQESLC